MIRGADGLRRETEGRLRDYGRIGRDAGVAAGGTTQVAAGWVRREPVLACGARLAPDDASEVSIDARGSVLAVDGVEFRGGIGQ